MGWIVPVATAIGGLLTGGAAIKNAFSKPKSPSQAPAPKSLREKLVAAEAQKDEQRDATKQKVGSLALLATSPQGLTDNPNYGRSKLLGS